MQTQYQEGIPEDPGAGVLMELDPLHDPRWDQYVADHPEGTIYHHSAWMQVLTQTYGYAPCHLGLISPDGSNLAGILPLFFVKSLFTWNRLVSLPFTSYCTPLMPESKLEGAIGLALARFPGARHAELRLLETGHGNSHRLSVKTPYITQVLSLEGDSNELFMKFHSTCVRQRVRHAERNGLIFRRGANESELRRFYQLLTKVRFRRGLPSAPYEFYSNMSRIMGAAGLFDLFVVEHKGEITAGAVILKGKRTWHLEYSASDDRFLKLSPNQLLIWGCIKLAREQGTGFFDFGRTATWQQSLIEFKDRWHTERRPIFHRYFPEKTAVPHWRDPSRSLLASLNKKLPPRLVEWEGRILYRHRG